MKIIFGLGNPGAKYENNYHNLGFLTLDILAKKLNCDLNKSGRKGVYGECNLNGEKVLLVKPQTYMNNSGECVSAFMAFYKVLPKDVLVIYDDIDIDKGSIRFRPQGSPGTHNGMRNIENVSRKGNGLFKWIETILSVPLSVPCTEERRFASSVRTRLTESITRT